MELENVLYAQAPDGSLTPLKGWRYEVLTPCEYEVIHTQEDNCKSVELWKDRPSLSLMVEVACKEFSGVPFDAIMVGTNIGEYPVMDGSLNPIDHHQLPKRIRPYRVVQDEHYKKWVKFLGHTVYGPGSNWPNPTLARLLSVAEKEFPGTPISEIVMTLSDGGPSDVVGLAVKMRA